MSESGDWDDETETPTERVKSALQICGCSETDDLLRLVRDVLADCEAHRWDDLRQLLRYETDRAHYYAVLNWLDVVEVLEHGTAIRCSWPTGKGRAVLALLREAFPT